MTTTHPDHELTSADPHVRSVVAEVTAWPGVEVHPHRFGGVEFRVGRRELGHVHVRRDDPSFADLPFPRRIRDELVGAGRARRHQWLPDSGWVTVMIGGDDDVRNATALFRMGYDRAVAATARRGV